MIHAQFEAIHPYGDSNGRLGRVLISRTLHRRGVTTRFTVPISITIARDIGGYLSGLRLFERGSIDPWGQMVRGHGGESRVRHPSDP